MMVKPFVTVKDRLRAPWCPLLAALSLPAMAQPPVALDAPLAISNRSPFVQVYGLPMAQGAQLAAPGQLTAALQVDIANSFSRDSSASEAIIIDGETLRTNLQLRYGLTAGLELGLDVPYLSHDGGSLDGFIDGWHELWGLPDGDRPDFARDQLQFSYQGAEAKTLTRAKAGIGDTSISLGYQLASQPARQWALRAALKLPTGDAGALLGSESTDVSLAIHVSDQTLSDQYQLRWHGSAGVLWMDEGEVLNALREDYVAYGSTTLSWQYSPALQFKLQLDAHSAFYDSSLTELGSDALQLTLGGTVRLSEQWLVDVAVVEDIAVDTAPDVVFHVALKTLRW